MQYTKIKFSSTLSKNTKDSNNYFEVNADPSTDEFRTIAEH